VPDIDPSDVNAEPAINPSAVDDVSVLFFVSVTDTEVDVDGAPGIFDASDTGAVEDASEEPDGLAISDTVSGSVSDTHDVSRNNTARMAAHIFIIAILFLPSAFPAMYQHLLKFQSKPNPAFL